MRTAHIRPKFVESIPNTLEEGVLYISQRFRMCSHLCCCGCGEEVATPLSSAEWSISYEGELVSLWPSIGNWDYECRSHYIIQHGRVQWARQMTNKQIARVQRQDQIDLEKMFALNNTKMVNDKLENSALPVTKVDKKNATTICGNKEIKFNNKLLKLIRRLMCFLFGK